MESNLRRRLATYVPRNTCGLGSRYEVVRRGQYRSPGHRANLMFLPISADLSRLEYARTINPNRKYETPGLSRAFRHNGVDLRSGERFALEDSGRRRARKPSTRTHTGKARVGAGRVPGVDRNPPSETVVDRSLPPEHTGPPLCALSMTRCLPVVQWVFLPGPAGGQQRTTGTP